jgi:hypothetical protein
MLTEFDQTTIANMTAALDFVCKKIPADKDSNELRKRIGDELVRCARMGRRSLIDLQQAGMKVMEETATPTRSSWFAWKEVALECLSTHCALHLEAELTFFPSRNFGLPFQEVHAEGARSNCGRGSLEFDSDLPRVHPLQ